ncbi:hypothetical protein [Ramlibacter albus]|uniref:Uncharacterized protein n=1 Tax=Ramlibacter albus TaxID=2079448 RepID=A0A923MD30_9BURK|nr:hypothetical protein [Ramlibacter albus]MBC5766832.1 hypothetical protein [Ramlibacter albus]
MSSPVPKQKCPAGARHLVTRNACYLLLRLDERLLLLLPPLLLLRDPLALARPPDEDDLLPLDRLLPLLPPLEADARLELLLLLRPDDDGDREEDDELRDAIACTPCTGCRATQGRAGPRVNLGASRGTAVGALAFCL